jgi:hypothetical protein
VEEAGGWEGEVVSEIADYVHSRNPLSLMMTNIPLRPSRRTSKHEILPSECTLANHFKQVLNFHSCICILPSREIRAVETKVRS